jgi:hypothetical protein
VQRNAMEKEKTKERKVRHKICRTWIMSPPHGPKQRKKSHAGITERNPPKTLTCYTCRHEMEFRMASELEMRWGVK